MDLALKFWVAYAPDGSVIIPFRNEIECLRVALKRGFKVSTAKFGDDLTELAIVDSEVIGTEVTP